MTLTERFDELPEPVQRHLIRIARRAAGMSTEEKAQSQFWLGGIVTQSALAGPDELVLATEMVSACMRVVNEFDKAAGDRASVVVR